MIKSKCILSFVDDFCVRNYFGALPDLQTTQRFRKTPPPVVKLDVRNLGYTFFLVHESLRYEDQRISARDHHRNGHEC